MNTAVNDKPKKWILIGIPILMIVGSLMHFAFDFTGKNPIIGLFTPINESIWEHLKLAFFPIIAWWTIGYFLYSKNYYFKRRAWICSCIISAITSMIVITSFYYTYTGAFGIELLILDIFSLFLGIFIAQFLGLHLYKYSNFNILSFLILLVTVVLIIIAFFVFTFYPPHIPLFLDSQTGTYGI